MYQRDNERVDKNDYEAELNNPLRIFNICGYLKSEPGIYTVSWLALSKDDGHITKGSYVFTVSIGGQQIGD